MLELSVVLAHSIGAIKNGNRKTFDLLLEKGSNIDHKDDQGRTPLYHAVVKGDLKMIEKSCKKRS